MLQLVCCNGKAAKGLGDVHLFLKRRQPQVTTSTDLEVHDQLPQQTQGALAMRRHNVRGMCVNANARALFTTNNRITVDEAQ